MNALAPIDTATAVELKPAPQAPALPAPPRVYSPKIAKAILAVTREIGHIAKDGENTFQGYRYARWEDIVEKLSPLLADHGLIAIQTEKTRHLIEQTDKGSTLSIVYGFTFTNEDGDLWPEIEWTALARLRDQKGITDDKAAAKCHTQAEKYFCIKQFKIRTGDQLDGDADGQTFTQEKPRGVLPKKDCRDIYTRMQAEIDGTHTLDALHKWGSMNAERIKTLPDDWQEILRTRYYEHRMDLRQRAPSCHAEGVIWDETCERPAEECDGIPRFLDRRQMKPA
jgi:hypothetical protein